jgi:hypothetical protein
LSDEVVAGFLHLDGTKKVKEIHKYDAMGEFRLVINTIDLTTILWDGSECKDIIEIGIKGGVNVVTRVVHKNIYTLKVMPDVAISLRTS